MRGLLNVNLPTWILIMKFLACVSTLSAFALAGCGGGVTSTLDELTQKLNENAFDELINDLGQTQETSYGTMMQSMITSQPDGDYRLTLLLPSGSIEEVQAALTTNLSDTPETIGNEASYAPEGITPAILETFMNGQEATYLIYSHDVDDSGLGVIFQPSIDQKAIFIGSGSPAVNLPSGLLNYNGVLIIQASDNYEIDDKIVLDFDMAVDFSNSTGTYTSDFEFNGETINVDANFKIESNGTFGGSGTVASDTEDLGAVSWDITTLGSFHNDGATTVSGVYQSDDPINDGGDLVDVTGGFTASR